MIILTQNMILRNHLNQKLRVMSANEWLESLQIMCIKEKRCLSFVLGIHLISGFIPFSFPFPVFHEEIDSHGLAAQWTGLVLGASALPSFLLVAYLNRLVHRFGRKRVYLMGFYVVNIGFALFGVVGYIRNGPAFLILSLVLRTIQGGGQFLMKVVILSIGAKRFPKNIDSFNSFIFNAINLGLGVGPLFAKLFSSVFPDFSISCLFTTGLNLVIFAPLGHWMLRDEAPQLERMESPSPNRVLEAESESGRNHFKRVDTVRHERSVPVIKALCNTYIIACLSVFISYIYYQLFWGSSIAIELEGKHNKSREFCAIFLLLRSLAALTTTFFAPYVSKRIGRARTVMFALLFERVASILLGPSKMLGLPDRYELMMVAVIIKGLIDPFLFGPLFPMMITHFQARHRGRFFIGPISDVMGALGNTVIDISVILASFTGHIAYQALGFRGASDLFLVALLFVPIVFIPFSGAISCHGSKPEQYQTGPITKDSSMKLKQKPAIELAKSEIVAQESEPNEVVNQDPGNVEASPGSDRDLNQDSP